MSFFIKNFPVFVPPKPDRKYSHTNSFIIQHIVTLPKYGHGELNICRPHITDILRYT